MKFIPVVLLLSLSCLLKGQDTVSVVFIGDVMQHTKQLKAALISDSDTLLAESYDYSSYFSRMGNLISGADYAVANMEFPCGLPPYSGYPSFSAPSSLALEAKNSGIDLFLCANNHIFDRGKEGAFATIDTYEKMDIPYMGVYKDTVAQQKNNPFFVTLKGIKIAFINFSYGSNSSSKDVAFNRMDSIEVKKVIRKAFEENADIIIALPHWGEEYSVSTSDNQKVWREMLLREGVNAIVGTHPHVIEPVEVSYDSCGGITSVTAYSLGNFISNMSIKNTQLGMVLTLKFVKNNYGFASIAESKVDYIWCALKGKLEKNYTSFPVSEYLEREDDFIVKEEYAKMKRTYLHIKKLIGYGN